MEGQSIVQNLRTSAKTIETNVHMVEQIVECVVYSCLRASLPQTTGDAAGVSALARCGASHIDNYILRSSEGKLLDMVYALSMFVLNAQTYVYI
jgi:hypothetical protein